MCRRTIKSIKRHHAIGRPQSYKVSGYMIILPTKHSLYMCRKGFKGCDENIAVISRVVESKFSFMSALVQISGTWQSHFLLRRGCL